MSTRRPRDIGNDQMSLRTDSNGVLDTLVFYAKPDLRKAADRKIVRHAAERMLALVTWFEDRDRRAK